MQIDIDANTIGWNHTVKLRGSVVELLQPTQARFTLLSAAMEGGIAETRAGVAAFLPENKRGLLDGLSDEEIVLLHAAFSAVVGEWMEMYRGSFAGEARRERARSLAVRQAAACDARPSASEAGAAKFPIAASESKLDGAAPPRRIKPRDDGSFEYLDGPDGKPLEVPVPVEALSKQR